MSPTTLTIACYALVLITMLGMFFGIRKMTKSKPIKSFRLGSSASSYSKIIGEKWLEDHIDELPENQWSAADKDGLITSKPGLTALMAELSLKRINLTDVAIKFKETKDA